MVRHSACVEGSQRYSGNITGIEPSQSVASGEGFVMVDSFSGGVCGNSRAESGILLCESDGVDIPFVGYSQIRITENDDNKP